jgi:hypothetical protein
VGVAYTDVGKEREQERKLFRRSDCRKRPFSLSLEPAYSGLRRDVYNDVTSAWKLIQSFFCELHVFVVMFMSFNFHHIKS